LRRLVGAGGVAALFLFLAIASIVSVPEPVRGAPTVDYITIVDAPGGAGTWVSGRNYMFGDSDVFWAAGYNLTSGWVADVSAYWYVWYNDNTSWSLGVVRLNRTNAPSVRLDTSGYGVTQVNAYSWTGQRTFSNATGPLHVSVANVDSVIVRTDRGGAGTWVGDTTYAEGDTDVFYAAAYNAVSGFLGDITSNWTSSNPAVGYFYSYYPGGQCGNGTVGTECYPSATFYAVSGGFTYGTAAPAGTVLSNTTGKLTVIGIDSIRVVDAPGGTGSWVSSRDYLFADTDTFWAAGYNTTSGWVRDVLASWYPYPNPTGQGSGVIELNASYGTTVGVRAIGYGVSFARATFYTPGTNRTYLTNDTGPLRVSVANVDSVVVRTDRGGLGTWVGPTTYEVGDRDTFWAAAYNATTGYLGDITSSWSSLNSGVGSITPTGVNGTGYRSYFSALSLGFTYVTATPVGTTLVNSTGRLTVTGISIDYVQIRNAPNGLGTVVGPRTYFEREQDTYYAATYNFTRGYRGDAPADWGSNNSAVCEVHGWNGNAHGSSAQILLKSPGTCTITVRATTVSGPKTNTTGTLTVEVRTLVTVDDSGGADFLKIQDAVDFASDGYRIFIFDGTYAEHVVVAKELEIVGQTRAGVVIDGGGTGTGLFLDADRIVVHNLTVQQARYGVFLNQTNNTRLYDTTIQDYGTGLYNDRTLNAWVAYNLITRGEIGVVAYKAYDDAIRWNEISYNTVYGAKGYNARLRNCFNWNSLHNNKIGYYYDPTTDLPPYEFDGNVLTDNEIGVKVADSSAIFLANNTITGGVTGVQLLNSSSEVRANTISGVRTGVEFHISNSNLTGNAISAAQVGITGSDGAPRIEGNDIRVASGLAMVLSNLDGAVIRGNDAHGGIITITDSHIAVLAPVNSNVLLQDSTVQTLILDPNSRVEVRVTVRVRTLDASGAGLPGSSVSIRDARGALAFLGSAGPDGAIATISLTTEVRTMSGTDSRNPFTFEVTSGSARGVLTAPITSAGDVVVVVRGGAPPLALVAGIAAGTILSASLAGVFAVERSRYAFLSAFLGLYSRLNKDKVLENYNRGRVYGYIELNPGAHFNAILAALGMNNGALVYHIEVLHKEGLVTSRQDGMYRRFYPRDVQAPPVLENGTSEAQLRVLKVIQEMPGITQKELSRFLGLRQSTLAYQIDRLTAMGYVAGEKRGRKVAYRAIKGAH